MKTPTDSYKFTLMRQATKLEQRLGAEIVPL